MSPRRGAKNSKKEKNITTEGSTSAREKKWIPKDVRHTPTDDQRRVKSENFGSNALKKQH